MGNKNPYEIRLEILNMAKDNLAQQFYSQKEMLMTDWSSRMGYAMDNKHPLPSSPNLPNFPTEEQIIEKAMILEKFVSGDFKNN